MFIVSKLIQIKEMAYEMLHSTVSLNMAWMSSLEDLVTPVNKPKKQIAVKVHHTKIPFKNTIMRMLHARMYISIITIIFGELQYEL